MNKITDTGVLLDDSQVVTSFLWTNAARTDQRMHVFTDVPLLIPVVLRMDTLVSGDREFPV